MRFRCISSSACVLLCCKFILSLYCSCCSALAQQLLPRVAEQWTPQTRSKLDIVNPILPVASAVPSQSADVPANTELPSKDDVPTYQAKYEPTPFVTNATPAGHRARLFRTFVATNASPLVHTATIPPSTSHPHPIHSILPSSSRATAPPAAIGNMQNQIAGNAAPTPPQPSTTKPTPAPVFRPSAQPSPLATMATLPRHIPAKFNFENIHSRVASLPPNIAWSPQTPGTATTLPRHVDSSTIHHGSYDFHAAPSLTSPAMRTSQLLQQRTQVPPANPLITRMPSLVPTPDPTLLHSTPQPSSNRLIKTSIAMQQAAAQV